MQAKPMKIKPKLIPKSSQALRDQALSGYMRVLKGDIT